MNSFVFYVFLFSLTPLSFILTIFSLFYVQIATILYLSPIVYNSLALSISQALSPYFTLFLPLHPLSISTFLTYTET